MKIGEKLKNLLKSYEKEHVGFKDLNSSKRFARGNVSMQHGIFVDKNTIGKIKILNNDMFDLVLELNEDEKNEENNEK